MKQIRKTFGIIAWLAAIMLLALASCNSLDTHTGYTDNLAKCQKNDDDEDGKIFKMTYHDYLQTLNLHRSKLA